MSNQRQSTSIKKIDSLGKQNSNLKSISNQVIYRFEEMYIRLFDGLLKQRTERVPGIQMKRYEAKEIRIKMKEGETKRSVR